MNFDLQMELGPKHRSGVRATGPRTGGPGTADV